METKIIKLFDNEKWEYPLIELKENGLQKFKKILKKYQKNSEYNIDDFLLLIEKKEWFIRAIYHDEEIFF